LLLLLVVKIWNALSWQMVSLRGLSFSFFDLVHYFSKSVVLLELCWEDVILLFSLA
jgi:hypothetical protein